MRTDDLIALGLHSHSRSASADRPRDSADSNSGPLERLLTILRDLVAVVERQIVFDGTLQNFNDRVQLLERQLTMTREEATLDPLTRILNRGGFDSACRKWLATEKQQFVLALVDVDDFKRINDVHGHGV